jgi:hypothetical protein
MNDGRAHTIDSSDIFPLLPTDALGLRATPYHTPNEAHRKNPQWIPVWGQTDADIDTASGSVPNGRGL